MTFNLVGSLISLESVGYFLKFETNSYEIVYKFSKCAYEILIKMLFILYLVSFGIRQGSRVQPKAKSINRFFFISRT